MDREIKYNLDFVGNFRLGYFATGSYMCTCAICGKPFTGDKRSVHCLSCSLGLQEDSNNAMLSIINRIVGLSECGYKFTEDSPLIKDCKKLLNIK